MSTHWRIELLGGLRVRLNDRFLARFSATKVGALLARLAFDPYTAHTREDLATILWPEADGEAGRLNLRVALNALRQQLEPGETEAGSVLVADRATVRLDPAIITTDVADFHAARLEAVRTEEPARRVALLSSAAELYRGALLPGFYEDWVLTERDRLADICLDVLRELTLALEQTGDLPRALDYARRAVALDPVREEAHSDLMRLYAAAGQTDDALRQYRKLERRMREMLGAEPSAAIRELAEQLRRRSSVPVAPRPPAASEKTLRQEAICDTPPPNGALPAVLATVGGAVDLDSRFYIVRPVDGVLRAAIDARTSIVLLKGGRQMGKTSLLARGVQQARQAQARVAITDLQTFSDAQLGAADSFCFALIVALTDQLDLEVEPRTVWNPDYGANLNLDRFLRRHVLKAISEPVVWALDEVDRLFHCDFAPQVFGLLRSRHNRRSLEPDGAWDRLTLVLACATEAHLFITDQDQSPFNVGARLTLDDFTPEQVGELNLRYGSPLRNEEDRNRFYALVSGQPYLTQRGLHAMTADGLALHDLEAQSDRDTGPFGDHLRNLLASLMRDAELTGIVRNLLRGETCNAHQSFYRLRSAGVIVGDTPQDARLRCRVYASYLAEHLSGT